MAFVSGGSLFAMVKAAADQPYTPPQLVSSPAINPSIDLSVNDVAYLSFTNPAGGGGGDVVVARKDRKATAFGVVPMALDINPAAPAGLDTGRSKVAVAADGVALVVWGESGQVFARRVFERTVSVAPQPVSVPAAGPFPGSTADAPDVDVQDDSSFAWVVFRQVFLDAPGGHSRALAPAPRRIGVRPARRRRRARRLPVAGLRRAAAGRHQRARRRLRRDRVVGRVRSAPSSRTRSSTPASPLGAGVAGAALPVAATDENGDGLIAWQSSDQTIHARAYTAVRASRAVQAPQPEVALSSAAAGLSDAADGLEASADRAGDIAVAFVLGAPGAQGALRRLVRPRAGRIPPVVGHELPKRGGEPAEVVAVVRALGAADVRRRGRRPGRRDDDGDVARRSRGPGRRSPLARHRDRPPRPGHRDLAPHPAPGRDAAARAGHGLRHPPPRTGREGDGSPDGRQPERDGRHPASARIQIAWGDGSRTTARRGTHRYRRGGKLTLRVSVRDRANNVVVVRRSITIH